MPVTIGILSCHASLIAISCQQEQPARLNASHETSILWIPPIFLKLPAGLANTGDMIRIETTIDRYVIDQGLAGHIDS